MARTTWLTSPGAIEPLNPPIAGLAGVAAANGLTEQYLYDDNLADGIGLESATGIAPLLGTGSISLSVALAKLADAQANGGAAGKNARVGSQTGTKSHPSRSAS